MNDPGIKRICILPLGLVNAHLIHNTTGAILGDTGLPDTEKKVLKALKQIGLTYENIKLIIITHAHVDHAGNAAHLRELTGAPIIAHAGDLPSYRRVKEMTFCATGWFGRLFLQTGLMYQPYTAFEPDTLLSEHRDFDLAPFGFSGRVRPTPGHTPGSLSVELESGQALVGDLIASGILLGGVMLTNHPKQPPFEDNPAEVATALSKLVGHGHNKFYMGHGGPLNARQVKRHSKALLQKYS
jgi:glyoxylase-like metal-dependent hydrolase (beta-lactamase superfamily II)